MAFNTLLITLGCLTALSISGFVNAYADPQLQQQQQILNTPSEACLKCLCWAMSKCNPYIGCDNDVCGMFRITRPYWEDSGSPVVEGDDLNDDLAYWRCTNDPTCAKISTINYLTKFAQDCDGDGSINCLDYASIHMLGGYGCNGVLNPQFKSKIESCPNPDNGPIVQQNANIIPQNPAVPYGIN